MIDGVATFSLQKCELSSAGIFFFFCFFILYLTGSDHGNYTSNPISIKSYVPASFAFLCRCLARWSAAYKNIADTKMHFPAANRANHKK